MSGTLSLIELAGHVGLLLWGTHMVGTGVQRGFGNVLRRWLGRNLGGRFRAFFTGLGVTTLLQSSTATGLLATSFTATGVMALAPALAVRLGANVGRGILAQVMCVDIALPGPNDDPRTTRHHPAAAPHSGRPRPRPAARGVNSGRPALGLPLEHRHRAA